MKYNKKTWDIYPSMESAFAAKNQKINPVVLQLLVNRGIKERNDIEEFLSFDFDKYIHSPFIFKEMNKAVELVVKHIKAGSKVFVYGDYDADGVTSSAVLYDTLSTLKANVGIYIPERKSEGYGMNKNSIDFINDEGGSLIITVDCGIRNRDEVEYAKSLGMEVVITDHHPAPEDENENPDCILINPKLAREEYPEKMLAGVGVAFKFAEALISKSKLDDHQKNILINRNLDLLAIGTITDIVPLLGENRALLRKGLLQLNKTKRPGLLELIKIAGLNKGKALDSWNVGFQIGPRLNAAGRLGHANTSFELLATDSLERASSLSQFLDTKNIERQKITEEVVNELRLQVKDDDKIIIGVTPESEHNPWEEGVVGLVAGKMTERYKKPSLVITLNDGDYKGSGRSIDGFNLVKAVEHCREYLDKYGGHAKACGFKFKKENLDKFIQKIRKYTEEHIKLDELSAKLKIDMELKFENLNEELVEEINSLAPFGEANPSPLFCSFGVLVVDKMEIGQMENHLKLKLKNNNSDVIPAIGFNQVEKWKDIFIGDKIDIAYRLDINDYNGRREVQLKIVDIVKL